MKPKVHGSLPNNGTQVSKSTITALSYKKSTQVQFCLGVSTWYGLNLTIIRWMGCMCLAQSVGCGGTMKARWWGFCPWMTEAICGAEWSRAIISLIKAGVWTETHWRFPSPLLVLLSCFSFTHSGPKSSSCFQLGFVERTDGWLDAVHFSLSEVSKCVLESSFRDFISSYTRGRAAFCSEPVCMAELKLFFVFFFPFALIHVWWLEPNRHIAEIQKTTRYSLGLRMGINNMTSLLL